MTGHIGVALKGGMGNQEMGNEEMGNGVFLYIVHFHHIGGIASK